MAKSCCGQSECSCLIQAGDGIFVTGSGSANDPYKIAADFPSFSNLLKVSDTDTVNMSLIGSGTEVDPFTLSASATIKLTQLADVSDPQGGPAIGESPVWVGTGPAGHWEFSTPPPSPAGAVNVSNGIGGVGSAPDPIKVLNSGVWGVGPLAGLGSDSTIGSPIYIDSNGQVRAAPVSQSVDWSAIANKPATFPPSAHTHTASQITDPLNLNVGIVRDHPFFITQTEDTGWAIGTVWMNWTT